MGANNVIAPILGEREFARQMGSIDPLRARMLGMSRNQEIARLRPATSPDIECRYISYSAITRCLLRVARQLARWQHRQRASGADPLNVSWG